jgi:hypothetical protein
VKKILIIILGVLMLILMSSFLSFFFGRGLSESTKAGHKIAPAIGKKIASKYGLRYAGISEKGTKEKYEIIGLEFYCKRILSKDEGRRILLQCAEEFLEGLNSSSEFQQYMVNYPFNGENIIINIYIYSPITWDVYHPDISVFSFYDDVLHYMTNSPQNQYVYFSKEKETLEEAKRIVASQEKNSD